MYMTEDGKLLMCSSDLHKHHQQKLREQRKGLKKLLTVLEDLNQKYQLWLQKRLMRSVVKRLPELRKSLTKK